MRAQDLAAAAEGLGPGPQADAIRAFTRWAAGIEPAELQARYVETFDFSRRASLYLTYHTLGDRRQRGMALLALKQRYAAAGLDPAQNTGELPDYLPMLLEFAALEPEPGHAALARHREALELLRAGAARGAQPVGAAARRRGPPAAGPLERPARADPRTRGRGAARGAGGAGAVRATRDDAGGGVMERGELLLYGVLPYAAIATFLVGHWWRYRTDQVGWTARSTQILESRMLRIGSIAFHVGALAAIGGHVLGILVPVSWTDAVGLNEDAYHVVSVIGGLTAGLAVVLGLVVLIYRRTTNLRVRRTTTRMDVAVFAMLAFAIVTGLWVTVLNTVDETHYREHVAPWFRGILTLDPQPERMADAPLILQVHVTQVWLLYALWPFSRLVHVWSIPVDWFFRSPILYRSRGDAAAPADPRCACPPCPDETVRR